MTSTIKGQLEIDHERGVIYFHISDLEAAKEIGAITLLRICSLPVPIPKHGSLNITHMFGVSWRGKQRKEMKKTTKE